MTNKMKLPDSSGSLLQDLQTLIADARQNVALAVNSALVILYWKVGQRIRLDILKEKRAEYGKEILPTLSTQLVTEFGNGFSEKNLRRMVQFAEVFPDEKIVVTLSRQLGWSHFIAIIPLNDALQREFYTEMCRVERWSVRTLRQKIGGMLFERTALSRKPAELAKQELEALREEDRLTPDLVFRDPYFLDFLGLKDTYSEKDLETAILREMEAFILELGVGFSFVERQKRITVGDDDFYLDLLFYHRKLRCLVAIELKLDKFKPAYKGQMELYMRWLEKYEKQPGEGSPIGLILCASKSEEQIELLRLDEGGIRVSAYMTELPPKELLREKLHEAIRLARARLEQRNPKAIKGA
jgi:predicted nuclease of restriction endonuclease-like (RecB) superfamily